MYIVHAERNGCQGWDTVYITVTTYLPVRACSDTSFCRGNRAALYVINVVPGTTYTWKEQSGAVIGTSASIVVLPQVTSTYIVESQNGTNRSWDTVEVVVYDLAEVQTRDTTVCAGNEAIVSVIANDQNLRYLWRDAIGDVIATTKTARVRPVRTTSYTISATNIHGCEVTARQMVSVSQPIAIKLSIASTDSAEAGETIVIPIYAESNRDVDLSPLSFSVRINETMLGVANATHENGELVIRYSQNVRLTSTAAPIATIEGLVLANQALTDRWRITDVSTNLDTNCTAFTSTPGTLSVKPVCANDYFRIVLNPQGLVIYPNPAGDVISIESANGIDEVELYNTGGNRVKCELQRNAANETKDDSSGHSAGVYTTNLDTKYIPNGLYLLRIRIGTEFKMYTVMIVKP
jgi:hypothetical protein